MAPKLWPTTPVAGGGINTSECSQPERAHVRTDCSVPSSGWLDTEGLLPPALPARSGTMTHPPAPTARGSGTIVGSGRRRPGSARGRTGSADSDRTPPATAPSRPSHRDSGRRSAAAPEHPRPGQDCAPRRRPASAPRVANRSDTWPVAESDPDSPLQSGARGESVKYFHGPLAASRVTLAWASLLSPDIARRPAVLSQVDH